MSFTVPTARTGGPPTTWRQSVRAQGAVQVESLCRGRVTVTQCLSRSLLDRRGSIRWSCPERFADSVLFSRVAEVLAPSHFVTEFMQRDDSVLCCLDPPDDQSRALEQFRQLVKPWQGYPEATWRPVRTSLTLGDRPRIRCLSRCAAFSQY